MADHTEKMNAKQANTITSSHEFRDVRPAPVSYTHLVEVENPFGKCVLKAKVSQIVKPGVVHAQHGFWFPEKDGEEPSLYEVWRCV